ncbi:ATP-dependent acyl-CoA ligase [Pseudonocardia ailaonensis]|uniref:ATP-dependent acyl-CoA ligase n=1 Tax=Pseudonocardia ailaonensis TaxID=367279 RepID=A0ABN2MHY3_9PSEU
MFGDVIDARAAEQPDKTFMWIDEGSWTYRDLKDRVERAALALRRLGLGRGEVVASFGRTSFDALSLLFAASRVGGVYMPVNVQYKGDYLLHQLRDAGATVVLADRELLDRIEPLVGELPALRTVLVADGDVETDRKIGHVRLLSAAELRREGTAEELAALLTTAPTPWNQPACLFYTSGTTGVSKGVLLTQHNLITAAGLFNRNYGITADDIQYSAVPLFHISGAYTSVITVLVGGRTGVLDTRFSVSTCWDRIRELGATVFFGVGAMVLMLWGLPPSPEDRTIPIRLMLTAPIPVDLWRPIEERYGCEILTGYGQSEVVMLTQMIAGEDNIPGSCGRVLDLYELRIVDDEDEDVPVGEPGEIVMRPKQNHVMFEGYVGRPEATLAQMRNLWFHTGDLGKLDESGTLYFIDRKKDAIRRRGENISSFEVEKSVLAHAQVAECAAFAVPSSLGEDEVMIAVVAQAGGTIDVAALADHCVEALPRFARPRYIEVVPALPKSVTGRVQKHELRAIGVGPSTYDTAEPRS